jgi:membrane-bound serine protease (ClpP class)
VLRLQRGPGDRLIAFLSDGTVTFFLITILSIAIYTALHAPGHGMAEVVIVACLGVLLGVPLLTGYAEWWEVLCVLVGLVLLALEIFVIPSVGIIGVAGIVMVIAGLVMTLVPPLPPNMPGFAPRLVLQWDMVTRALLLVLGAMFTALIAAFFISRYLPSLPIGRKLVLTATAGRPLGGSGGVPPAGESGGWIKPGDRGTATTDLRPGGRAAFFDPAINDQRPVDVMGDGGFIRAGTAVIVHELRGQVIIVRRAPQ